MGQPLLHIIKNQHCWLMPERCIYWEEAKAIILSDAHFGKTGHFRKSGIAVPQDLYKEDLQRFFSVITTCKPTQVLVVGDFFHSTANEELNLFLKWKNDIPNLTIRLIKGNHDILGVDWYNQANIELIHGQLQIGPFSFQHDPAEQLSATVTDDFIFSGHLHPGIQIKGLGKQSLRFPCFYITEHQCILPAFSKFSGLAILKPKKQDAAFAIVNDQLIHIA